MEAVFYAAFGAGFVLVAVSFALAVLRRISARTLVVLTVLLALGAAGAAAALGVSRQAGGQRLAGGVWELEGELRPTAARLLTRAGG